MPGEVCIAGQDHRPSCRAALDFSGEAHGTHLQSPEGRANSDTIKMEAALERHLGSRERAQEALSDHGIQLQAGSPMGILLLCEALQESA